MIGYPRHFCDGKYGLKADRIKIISPQQYFSQRILNVDKRFVKDATFLFVAQQYVERHALERQINISTQKGKIVSKGSGAKVVQSNDAFSVFKKVPGTPAYWKNFRNETFARLEQLGPFHLFWTLSCAHDKWPEIKANILQGQGHSITVTSPNGSWDGEASTIEVDGIPLEEFFEKIPKKSDFYKDEILLVTQMFDNRVKAFLKNIFLSNAIAHYSYRIEFQVRGMPHVRFQNYF